MGEFYEQGIEAAAKAIEAELTDEMLAELCLLVTPGVLSQVAVEAFLSKQPTIHWCVEHSTSGGPKRCQTGAQIAPDVCQIVERRLVEDGEQ